jgi:hypothetical protein
VHHPGCRSAHRDNDMESLITLYIVVKKFTPNCKGSGSALRASSGLWEDRIPANGGYEAVSLPWTRRPRLRLTSEGYSRLRSEVLSRDAWRCQRCGTSSCLEVHHLRRRNQLGDDTRENLITLCAECHGKIHTGGCILASGSRST